ncbi:MAG: aminotransferase class V-fold PLP-dependent enzyme [Verrucomicrobia bacterium]|nr:aminotransferase class V-fold PLP-dependent enzyme [Verrucomicrobiota bacterium]
MTLSQLHSDEALRRREFPVAESKAFLAHAGVCPLPFRVAEAICQCAAASTTGDQESLFFPSAISRSRELAARLLGCGADEIALVGPTSLALSLVAAGLHFRSGDNVVLYFDDYPSNVYPWMALADRGVEVRRLQTQELGLITPDEVMAQVDPQTRLVALASCHFIGGWRIDLDAIGQVLHDRGVLFCVDGIQTVGAFPTSVRHVDFLAADAHKWMLGPCAAGVLYVRAGVQDQLKPTLLGWHNVRCPDFVAQEELVFRDGARRYEAGTHNLLGIVGLNAAFELLLEVGVGNIAVELLRQRSLLVDGLEARGWEVLHAAAGESAASGIVSFRAGDRDVSRVHAQLLEQGVVTSLRTDRRGRRFIRVSPHFYNTDEELNRLLDLV